MWLKRAIECLKIEFDDLEGYGVIGPLFIDKFDPNRTLIKPMVSPDSGAIFDELRAID